MGELLLANLMQFHLLLIKIKPHAIFVGGAALSQLWLFWVAAVLGGVVGGLIYKYLLQRNEHEVAA